MLNWELSFFLVYVICNVDFFGSSFLTQRYRSKYIEICLYFLDSNQFTKLYNDPTHTAERKFQRTLQEVKRKLPANIYSKVYSTGSSQGKLYGTVKIHKLDTNGKVDDLPIRPIISNILGQKPTTLQSIWHSY